MKGIISAVFVLIIIPACSGVFAADQISVFRGSRAVLITISKGSEYRIMVDGGAIPDGAATAGECFIESDVHLKKLPNYYEGNFNPVNNEILAVDSDHLGGRGIGIFISSDSVNVTGAEVDGICARGIDFSGKYDRVEKRAFAYKESYINFMKLAHENSLYLLSKKHGAESAVASLKPFVDSYDASWVQSADDLRILIPILNDYAFALQKVGRNSEAIPIFHEVIKLQTNRVVVWINIADSYWALKNYDEAGKNYSEYVLLMTKAGLKAKIPKRAIDRKSHRSNAH